MLNSITAEACLRQTSRPNSTSSSSTIRRTASLSSQPGSRVSYFGYSGRHIPDDSQRKSKYPNGSAPIQIAAATVTIPASSPSRPLKDGDPVTRGHSRYRGHNSGRSASTEAGSSTSSTRSEVERGRKHRSPSQKTMLSRALQKANTAVLLDNAQNFEGAMEAYADACRLLQQVMHSSTGDEDKKKLEAIVRSDLQIQNVTEILT
jgi:MIT (microtubule interacting and transport) domain